VRYYLSANMPDTHDSEFSWEDFTIKINNELVAVLGNYYHRCLSFTHKNFGSIPESATDEESKEATDKIASVFDRYNEYLSDCEFKKALKTMMELAHFGNKYFDTSKPWALIKTDKEACGRVMNTNLRIVKALTVMAWPFLPKSSEKIWSYMGLDGSIEKCGYEGMTEKLPVGAVMSEPVPVYKKVEFEEENKPANRKKAAEPEITGPFADFRKLNLKAGTILDVKDHPDADKLYVMSVSVGEDSPRQIVAGLKAFYSKEDMIGRRVLVVSNLKPAKLRGIDSFGMLLAADDEELGGNTVLLLTPSSEVPDGTGFYSGLEPSSSRLDYKEFLKVPMKVSSVRDGKLAIGFDGTEIPDGCPSPVIVVADGKDAILLSDGKGTFATVDKEISDGAGVR